MPSGGVTGEAVADRAAAITAPTTVAQVAMVARVDTAARVDTLGAAAAGRVVAMVTAPCCGAAGGTAHTTMVRAVARRVATPGVAAAVRVADIT